MKVPCLVLDHDDTLVNSTATVHFPCFVEYTQKYFPDYHCTLEHYFLKNFSPGFLEMCREEYGMDEAMIARVGPALVGARYENEALAEAVRALARPQAEELAQWLSTTDLGGHNP